MNQMLNNLETPFLIIKYLYAKTYFATSFSKVVLVENVLSSYN